MLNTDEEALICDFAETYRIYNYKEIPCKMAAISLGPKGRNVIIEKKFGAPHITKDGVTVAKEVELADAFQNTGAQLVKSVASKTGDDAGDGTKIGRAHV